MCHYLAALATDAAPVLQAFGYLDDNASEQWGSPTDDHGEIVRSKDGIFVRGNGGGALVLAATLPRRFQLELTE